MPARQTSTPTPPRLTRVDTNEMIARQGRAQSASPVLMTTTTPTLLQQQQEQQRQIQSQTLLEQQQRHMHLLWLRRQELYRMHHEQQFRLAQQAMIAAKRRREAERKVALEIAEAELLKLQQSEYIYKEDGVTRDYEKEVVAFIMGL